MFEIRTAPRKDRDRSTMSLLKNTLPMACCARLSYCFITASRIRITLRPSPLKRFELLALFSSTVTMIVSNELLACMEAISASTMASLSSQHKALLPSIGRPRMLSRQFRITLPFTCIHATAASASPMTLAREGRMRPSKSLRSGQQNVWYRCRSMSLRSLFAHHTGLKNVPMRRRWWDWIRIHGV